MLRTRDIKEFIKVPAHILYHIAIIAISAGIALSMPYTVSFLSRQFHASWELIGDEKIFLLAAEIILAVLLILFFNYTGWVWRDRRLARIARNAGLVFASSSRGIFARRKSRKLKETQGIARDIMVMGATGFRTFTDPRGDLHAVIKNCRKAKIMLLNPASEGAATRVKSILDPEITLEKFREQIKNSIDFLKELKAVQKDIRLKLYHDVPFLKMALSGDYLWVNHYHAGCDVQVMPEYVLVHNQNPGSLYTIFYQYFLSQWNDPAIPEYDLETDELVYRDIAGNEGKRERIEEREMTAVN
ncbi:MAG: hypothetical protein Q8K68_01860 [Nitrospirota bacterium]|nr:hypothetical protein [Nitrospirota bacterium]